MKKTNDSTHGLSPYGAGPSVTGPPVPAPSPSSLLRGDSGDTDEDCHLIIPGYTPSTPNDTSGDEANKDDADDIGFGLQLPPMYNEEDVREKFKNNPNPLLHELNVQKARTRGIVCPACGSGSGPNGTGMDALITEKGDMVFKCFSCGESFGPIKLVRYMRDYSVGEALGFLAYFYSRDHPEYDGLPPIYDPKHSGQVGTRVSAPLQKCEALEETVRLSKDYASICHDWKQTAARNLGLPVEALNRPDIGKSFMRYRTGKPEYLYDNDGMNPKCGDLVTFNYIGGVPASLKTRPVGYEDSISYYSPNDGYFHLSKRKTHHEFRLAGPSGYSCFGHDNVTGQTDIVVITEGQSDVLAVDIACQDNGATNVVAIGRDSANHILTAVDLDVLEGKRIIYCEDPDPAGKKCTEANLALLMKHGCNTSIWTPGMHGIKDPRDLYIKHGGRVLVESLLSTTN